MAVSDDVLRRAQRGDLSACAAMLADAYPAAARMARALTGNDREAERVVDFVLRRGATLMPGWRRGTIPENWFYHHTLLAARERAATTDASPSADLLLAATASAGPDYTAFVRAVRGLPVQQSEAFLLHHGERFNSRLLGVAMDCSSTAAENHLKAANAAMAQLAGSSLQSSLVILARAYAALGPPLEQVHIAVQPYAKAYTRPLRVRRILRRVLVLLLLVIIGVAWHWRDQLRHWLESLNVVQSAQKVELALRDWQSRRDIR